MRMSGNYGYFNNGRWIETSQPVSSNMEIGIKVSVDDSELDELTKELSQLGDYYRLRRIEQTVQKAGFKKRLWYLITGKL